MLPQYPTTIPVEIRDFPKWHRGRETYAVWVLRVGDASILDIFKSAQKHLSRYLLEPYRRQPHITLFVCGFLVDAPHYNDDFTSAQLQAQRYVMEQAQCKPFEIEIGGLNSFASAPFLEVRDPDNGIAHLREILACGGREFRTAPYRPHLTVGLYGGAFDSQEVTGHLSEFPSDPIRWKVESITLATYRAREIAGPLIYQHKVSFIQE
ncbi:MAG: 2'-5' RNA ligase family protein [Anaerolineales bacterium]|jgi:2'-5' RNA ligase